MLDGIHEKVEKDRRRPHSQGNTIHGAKTVSIVIFFQLRLIIMQTRYLAINEKKVKFMHATYVNVNISINKPLFVLNPCLNNNYALLVLCFVRIKSFNKIGLFSSYA